MTRDEEMAKIAEFLSKRKARKLAPRKAGAWNKPLPPPSKKRELAVKADTMLINQTKMSKIDFSLTPAMYREIDKRKRSKP